MFDSPLGSVEHVNTNGLDLVLFMESEVTDTAYVLAGWTPDIAALCAQFVLNM